MAVDELDAQRPALPVQVEGETVLDEGRRVEVPVDGAPRGEPRPWAHAETALQEGDLRRVAVPEAGVERAARDRRLDVGGDGGKAVGQGDRKSTRLNSS